MLAPHVTLPENFENPDESLVAVVGVGLVIGVGIHIRIAVDGFAVHVRGFGLVVFDEVRNRPRGARFAALGLDIV